MAEKKVAGKVDAKEPKKEVDWSSIELHFRAGKRSLEDIGKEFGVTKGRISQVAKKEGWDRNLSAKIKAKADAKVARDVAEEAAKQEALNDPTKRTAKRLAEATVVEANANIVASAELVQRDDILLGLSVARGLLQEVATLSRPDLAETLERIGEVMDESGPNANGTWVKDKVNETYMYIISLAGRVKMAKETAGTHGVYIPLQRKVLRMEDEADKGETTVDALLASVIGSK